MNPHSRSPREDGPRRRPTYDDAPLVELVDYIARAIVRNPDDVKVDAGPDDEEERMIVLSVADADRGTVIGKQGKLIRAIETVMRASIPVGEPRPVLEIVSERA